MMFTNTLFALDDLGAIRGTREYENKYKFRKKKKWNQAYFWLEIQLEKLFEKPEKEKPQLNIMILKNLTKNQSAVYKIKILNKD